MSEEEYRTVGSYKRYKYSKLIQWIANYRIQLILFLEFEIIEKNGYEALKIRREIKKVKDVIDFLKLEQKEDPFE